MCIRITILTGLESVGGHTFGIYASHYRQRYAVMWRREPNSDGTVLVSGAALEPNAMDERNGVTMVVKESIHLYWSDFRRL